MTRKSYDLITASPGVWHLEGAPRPAIVLERVRGNGKRNRIAPVDYRQARALADALHDLADEAEAAAASTGHGVGSRTNHPGA